MDCGFESSWSYVAIEELSLAGASIQGACLNVVQFAALKRSLQLQFAIVLMCIASVQAIHKHFEVVAKG